ncbi:MAG: glycosyltransferase family 2 protein [Spirochaetaceae bacterium]|nr:MAG: glycosyltransferase family 2 protein [Spirochaetaceae bacterium]
MKHELAQNSARTELDGLVSVVTAVHNGERFLSRVVESVAAQTVAVLEHIVIDDGSRDNTPTILRRLQERHPHLVVISQAPSGAAAARNRGIAAARGRYIAFLDADDLWLPPKLEHQLRAMEEHGYLFTYGDYNEVDHHSLQVRKRVRVPESVGHPQLLRGCPVGCLTAAYNQEALGKHYMPVVRSGHDWGLWLELTRDGLRAHKYPGVWAHYANGHSSLSSRKIRKAVNIYRLYRNSEGLSRPHALLRTAEHVAMALAKRARLIYTARRIAP